MSNLNSFKAYDIGRAYAADELRAQSSAERPWITIKVATNLHSR